MLRHGAVRVSAPPNTNEGVPSLSRVATIRFRIARHEFSLARRRRQHNRNWYEELGLPADPFAGPAPVPYWDGERARLLGEILLATASAPAVLAIIGPAGIGKSVLRASAAEHLEGAAICLELRGHVFLDPASLTRQLWDAWAAATGATVKEAATLRELGQAMALTLKEGSSVSILLDDADELPDDCLALLLNLGASLARRPLRIVLFGREALEARLAVHEKVDHVQLETVAPLEATDIASYLTERIQLAAPEGAPALNFREQELERIVRHSKGIPGQINAEARQALSGRVRSVASAKTRRRRSRRSIWRRALRWLRTHLAISGAAAVVLMALAWALAGGSARPAPATIATPSAPKPPAAPSSGPPPEPAPLATPTRPPTAPTPSESAAAETSPASDEVRPEAPADEAPPAPTPAVEQMAEGSSTALPLPELDPAAEIDLPTETNVQAGDPPLPALRRVAPELAEARPAPSSTADATEAGRSPAPEAGLESPSNADEVIASAPANDLEAPEPHVGMDPPAIRPVLSERGPNSDAPPVDPAGLDSEDAETNATTDTATIRSETTEQVAATGNEAGKEAPAQSGIFSRLTSIFGGAGDAGPDQEDPSSSEEADSATAEALDAAEAIEVAAAVTNEDTSEVSAQPVEDPITRPVEAAASRLPTAAPGAPSLPRAVANNSNSRIAGEREILSMPSNELVLQVMVLSSATRAALWLAEHRGTGSYATYRRSGGPDPAWVILHGPFVDRSGAEFAAREIEQRTGVRAPWIRSVAEVQAEIEPR